MTASPEATPGKRVTTAQQRLIVLRSRMDTYNVKADEALADYASRDARLKRRHFPDKGAYAIAKRDDTELADLGSAAVSHTATAARLAATLAVELLALIVRLLEAERG